MSTGLEDKSTGSKNDLVMAVQTTPMLSPPVSPERSGSPPITKDRAAGGWMVIKSSAVVDGNRRGTKRSINTFLSLYEVRGVKKRNAYEGLKKPTKRGSPKTECSTAQIRENPSQGGRIGTERDTSCSSEDISIRRYSTRSRLPSCEVSRISSSSPIKFDAKPEAGTSGSKHSSKAGFLRECTVQIIHDSPIGSIPNFEPSFTGIPKRTIERAIKKAGCVVNVSSSKDFGGTDLLHGFDSREILIMKAFKLTPLQYADTKRRFFAEKARRTMLSVSFKKTDAQKACRIDVNKASKLYEVFGSLGLLDDELFTL